MNRWLSAVLPRRIGGQILLLVVVAVVLTQALNFGVLVVSDQGRRAESQIRSGIGMFISGVQMMANAPSSDWPVIAGIVQRAEPGLHFAYQPNGNFVDESSGDPGPLGFLQHDLGPRYQISDSPLPGREAGDLRLVSVLMPDGTVISGELQIPPPPPRPPLAAFSFLIFALVFLPLIYFWAAWGLSRQLNRFARAAEGFSAEGQHEQLPENGPEEIAHVARALNRMRERIMGLLSDRTRMLSAIGHDLRTPITRLRLRAEFIEDEHTRQDILKDLDRMNRMVDSALTYLRDGHDSEQPVAIDLPALLRTVSDNFTDVGESVTYEGEEHLSIVAQPDGLVRAVENLVENALKHGSLAVVRSGRQGPEHVFIEVEDDGAGIPEDKRTAMLEPFVRGDLARGGAAGGFGLGLSITDSITRAHSGRLELSSGRMGGLLARIVLPARIEPVRQAA